MIDMGDSHDAAQILCGRYPEKLLRRLGVDGLRVIHEERDVFDTVSGLRIFPSLSEWERLHQSLVVSYFRNKRILACDMMLGRELVRHNLCDGAIECLVFPDCISLISSGDIVCILLIPEIGDAQRFSKCATDVLYSQIASGNMLKYWFPNDADGGGMGPAAGDSFMATRLFVLASSPDCVDKMVTMARLSI